MPTRSGKCWRVCHSSCSAICSGTMSYQSSIAALPSRAIAGPRESGAGRAFDHRLDRTHRHGIPLGAEPGDDGRGHLRHERVVVVRLAPVDVGDVQLDDGAREHLQCVEDGDGRERIGGRIDDDAGPQVDGFMDPVDELRLAVRLPEFDRPVEFRQSNSESQLIDWIHEAIDLGAGIVINPAAYSFTSIAILDALKMFSGPIVELHISNIHRREPHYHHSFVSKVATAVIAGLGPEGYPM